MKKQLLLIITLLLFIPNVYAEEIPTPYILESPSVNASEVLFEVTEDTNVIFVNKKSTDKTNVVAKLPEQYNITYKLNNGTNNNSNPGSYTSNDIVKLKNPTRKGYIFKGWYKDSKYKTKITTIKKGSKGNITLYAKWTPITYNIKFYANGGKGKMSTMKNRKYNKTYKLTKNKYTRKGYKFVGWTTNKKGTGKVYKNKASIKNLTTKNKATIKLYAKWSKK